MKRKSQHKHPIAQKSQAEDILPPLLYPPKNKTDEAWMTSLKKQKKIRKIGPRLYTSLKKNEAEALVHAQWATLISNLYPKAILSHRSALEYKPSENNTIYLTSSTNRTVKYLGLNLEFIRGPDALNADIPFYGFTAASTARALLENLSSTKITSHRSLPLTDIENRLYDILLARGEQELLRIRVQAKKLSQSYNWKKEFKKLDLLIGALLATQSDKILKTPRAKARVSGRPFDLGRVGLFDALASALHATPLKEIRDTFKTNDHFSNKAFFEAYFSNYIEGTMFEIEEAEEIIFDNKIPAARPKDAHDILGTYKIISDPNEMLKTPKTILELEGLLIARHAALMAQRHEVQPGFFKDRQNRAGDTYFVAPQEVRGTLEKGFERYLDLPDGLAKAIFMMFLITEVHPFSDGNGRIARIMMNAELFSNSLATIIIPTVYRDDYLLSLRALSRQQRTSPLIKMLARAHIFSCLDFSLYKASHKIIDSKNWFRESHSAKIRL